MTADLARFYGRRLTDLGTEKLTYPEFYAFMDTLPMDSALRRATHGDEFVEWSQVVHMLAQIQNALEWGNWQRGGGDGAKPRDVKPPVPWDLDPLPSVEEE